MSLKTAIASRVTAHMTSPRQREALRTKAERKRRARGAPHLITYFHQADDPYAHLVAQVLPELAARYDAELRILLVPRPPDWAAPDRQRLVDYSRTDAAHLAARAGLDFTDPGHQPPDAAVSEAEAILAAALADGRFLDLVANVGQALWRGAALPEGRRLSVAETAAAKAEGDKIRDGLGHYLGATFHYEGEWYWGIDRLHYLEARLAALGARRSSAPDQPIFPPDTTGQGLSPRRLDGQARAQLNFFCSFRSPYTYIVTERIKALADAYGADLNLCFVLPMVMRGLQVPRTKGLYILKDTAREAERLGVPFGKVADPVGEPVRRGYAILPWAIEEGRGHEFALSFMRGVWAEGLDAASDSGLRRITERAGLDWGKARALIGTADWQGVEAVNQKRLLELGLWGVPSFEVAGTATWGQDRLWRVEAALQRATGLTAPAA